MDAAVNTMPAGRRRRRLAAVAVIVASGLLVGAPPAATSAARGAGVCAHRSDPDRQQPARSGEAMVATAHPLASEVGCRVLARGGSVADAAVAVQMVLAVVESQSSGLGGGTMITYYDRRSGRVESYDGLSAAPAAVTDGLRTPTAVEARDLGVDSFPSDVTYTGRAVGIPGTASVLDQVHRRYGRLPWADLFGRAINLADDGFAMSPYLHDTLSAEVAGLGRCAYPDLGARYCRDGAPLPVGEMVRNAELADVLREVRDGGAAAFYDPAGTIAPAIAERAARGPYKLDSDEDGPAVIPSLMTAADFGRYRAVVRDPLCRRLIGRQICTAPPPSFGGLTVLQELALLGRAGVATMAPDSSLRTHYSIEISRLAQFDRREYIGDPDYQPAPITGLLADEYLDRRFALLSPTTAMPAVAPGEPGGDADATSQVSIVDRSGNAMSMTTTVNTSFGAQMEARGIVLNNVEENFTRPDSISPGQRVNGMEPNKRPRSSIAPTLVFDGRGRLDLVVGSAGGSGIPDYIVQTILGILVDGLDPQAALGQAHWSGQEIASNCGGVVGAYSELEEGSPAADLLDELRQLRHPCPRLAELRSGLTAIDVNPAGRMAGASDPRRDGVAVGQ